MKRLAFSLLQILLASLIFKGVALADGSFTITAPTQSYTGKAGDVVTIPVQLSAFSFTHAYTPNGVPASAEIDGVKGNSGFTIMQNSCSTIYSYSTACEVTLSYTVPLDASEGIHHYQVYLSGHDRGTTTVANFKSNPVDIAIEVTSAVTPSDEGLTLSRQDSRGATITVGSTVEFKYRVAEKSGNTLSPVSIIIPALSGLEVNRSDCDYPNNNFCEFSIRYTPAVTEIGSHDILVKVSTGSNESQENLHVNVIDKLPDNSTITVERDNNQTVAVFLGTSETIPYTVTNNGDTELQNLHLSIVPSSTKIGEITVVDTNGCEGKTFFPGDSCKFGVEYKAPNELAENSHEDTFSTAANAIYEGKDIFNASTATVTVDHKVSNDMLIVSSDMPSPSTIALGEQKTIAFTLANQGSGNIDLDTKVLFDAEDLSKTTVATVNNACAAVLAHDTTCTITVNYKADTVAQAGNHTLSVQAEGQMWGKALSNSAEVKITTPSAEGNIETSISTPSIIYSSYPSHIIFSVKNSTNADMMLNSIVPEIDTSLSLSAFIQRPDNCQEGKSLAKGETCYLEYNYEPAQTADFVDHVVKFYVKALQFSKTLEGNDTDNFKSKGSNGLTITEDTSHEGYVGHISGAEGNYYYTITDSGIPEATIRSIAITNNLGAEYHNVSDYQETCTAKVLKPDDSCTVSFHYKFVSEDGAQDVAHLNVDATDNNKEIGFPDYTINFTAKREVLLVQSPVMPQALSESHSFMLLNYYFKNTGTQSQDFWVDDKRSNPALTIHYPNVSTASDMVGPCISSYDATRETHRFTVNPNQTCFVQVYYSYSKGISTETAMNNNIYFDFMKDNSAETWSIVRPVKVYYIPQNAEYSEGTWLNSHSTAVPAFSPVANDASIANVSNIYDEASYRNPSGINSPEVLGDTIEDFVVAEISRSNLNLFYAARSTAFANNDMNSAAICANYNHKYYDTGSSHGCEKPYIISDIGIKGLPSNLLKTANMEGYFGREGLYPFSYWYTGLNANTSWLVKPNATILGLESTPIWDNQQKIYFVQALSSGNSFNNNSYNSTLSSYKIATAGRFSGTHVVYDAYLSDPLHPLYKAMKIEQNGAEKTVYVAEETSKGLDIRTIQFVDKEDGAPILGKTVTSSLPTECKEILSMQLANKKLYVSCRSAANYYLLYVSPIVDDKDLTFTEASNVLTSGSAFGLDKLSVVQMMGFPEYKINNGAKLYINANGTIFIFNTLKTNPYTRIESYLPFGYTASSTELDISHDDGATWERRSLDSLSPTATDLGKDISSYNLGFIPAETNMVNRKGVIAFYTSSTKTMGATNTLDDGGAIRVSFDEGASWQVYPFAHRNYQTHIYQANGGNYIPFKLSILHVDGDGDDRNYFILLGRYLSEVDRAGASQEDDDGASHLGVKFLRILPFLTPKTYQP
jgi:hypothetical protein